MLYLGTSIAKSAKLTTVENALWTEID